MSIGDTKTETLFWTETWHRARDGGMPQTSEELVR